MIDRATALACREQIAKITLWAQENQVCLRKAVGCSIVALRSDLAIKDPATPGELIEFVRAHNGPSLPDSACTNTVGSCGCSHAEPRAIAQVLNTLDRQTPLILCCTYSPCTSCANFIIDCFMIFGLPNVVVFEIVTKHDERGWDMLKRVKGLDVVWLREELDEGPQ